MWLGNRGLKNPSGFLLFVFSLLLASMLFIRYCNNLQANGILGVNLAPRTGTGTTAVIYPQVSTQATTGISTTSATGNGSIDSMGDTYPGVTDYGHIWGTSADPEFMKDPVDHYKLNDNAANTTVTDSGSAVHNGTASTNTSNLSVSGKLNSSFNFNGSNQYVDITSSNYNLSDFTISTWFFGSGPVIGSGENNCWPRWWMLYSGYFEVRTIGGCQSGSAVALNYSGLNANQWNHVVVTRAGAVLKIYVNGTLNATNNSFPTMNLTNFSWGTFIGRLKKDSGGYTTDWYFAGKIDDVRVYNYALNQNQVSRIYNFGTGIETTNLIAGWGYSSLGATSSTGPFTSSLTNLKPGTTFNIRAYVKTSDNTINYGANLTFATSMDLAQFKADGTTAISTGAYTDEVAATLKSTISNGGVPATLTPEYEIQQVGTAFTDLPNLTGNSQSYVATPLMGSASLPVNGTYWYDASWAKRRVVNITNTTASALTNYQTKMSIAYESGMNADFSDLRFTAADNSLLNYWIEKYTASSSATVWVKIPAVGANSSLPVFMYYQNASATSLSNGDNTFVFFDDFTGNAVDTGKWTYLDATGISVSNGYLNATSTTGWIESKPTFNKSSNLTLESKVLNTTIPSNGFVPLSTWLSTTNTFGGLLHPGSPLMYYYRNDGSWVAPANTTSYPNILTRIDILANSTTAIYYYDYATNGLIVAATGLANSVDNEPIRIIRREDDSYLGQAMDQKFDWIRVRAYAAVEPVVTTGRLFSKPVTLANDLSYHWQTRFCDEYSVCSNWNSYGGNAESAADFIIDLPENPSVPADLGPAGVVGGAYVNNSTPEFTFTLADPNPADTVKYRIQIATDNLYNSIVIDYSSALASQGTYTFTVGQAAGSGTYSTGSQGQVLADTNYFWQVKTIDLTNRESSFVQANPGNIAFSVDTTPPSQPGQPATVSPVYDSTPTWDWAESTDGGSGLANPAYTVEWCQNDTFAGCGANTDVANTTTYTNLTDLADGTWFFHVRASDNVGLLSNFSVNGSVVINTQPTPTPSPIPTNTPLPTSTSIPVGATATPLPATPIPTNTPVPLVTPTTVILHLNPSATAIPSPTPTVPPTLVPIGITVSPTPEPAPQLNYFTIGYSYNFDFYVADAAGNSLAYANVAFILGDKIYNDKTNGEGRVRFANVIAESQGKIVVTLDGKTYSQKLILGKDTKVVDNIIQIQLQLEKNQENVEIPKIVLIAGGLLAGVTVIYLGIRRGLKKRALP